jgi:hypothetical protein
MGVKTLRLDDFPPVPLEKKKEHIKREATLQGVWNPLQGGTGLQLRKSGSRSSLIGYKRVKDTCSP